MFEKIRKILTGNEVRFYVKNKSGVVYSNTSKNTLKKIILSNREDFKKDFRIHRGLFNRHGELIEKRIGGSRKYE